MVFILLLFVFNLIFLNQYKWPWEDKPIEEWYEGPALHLWVIAWIFLAIGIVALTILIIYTKFGREISIRLSVITIGISSIFLGFAFHFFLLNAGY